MGIGIETPSSALHLRNQETDIALKMRASGSWTAELRQTNASLLSLVNGGSERMTILPDGRVGIGTTSPTAMLEVNGSLKVNGDVTVPPTTRYLMISAIDMVPEAPGMIVHRSFTEINSSLFPAGQLTFLFAPVHLPQGATVTEISAPLFDDASNQSIQITLQGRDWNNNTIFMANISTEGTPGQVQATATSISHAVIDNETYAYYLFIVFTVPPADGGDLQIKPVRIAYEVTSLVPD
ncbi:MAG: hypothetical protein ACYTHJ_11475 [Planctomycetota bacterium]